MKFVKYQGCGNDAILLDTQADRTCANLGSSSSFGEMVRRMCDRTFGIGADVILLLESPSAGANADARMRIFNSDGCEAQMCSTGVRAIVKYLSDRRSLVKDSYLIQTGRGVLPVRAKRDGAGVCAATIEMGEPIFEPERIPVKLPGTDAIQVLIPPALKSILGGPCGGSVTDRMSVVSTGNPHVMFFCNEIDNLPLSLLGPAIERHELFPQRVNVHFVKIVDRSHARMRSWERGAGATLACGTGASAVVAAGVRAGLLDRRVNVDVPGGSFAISWEESSNQLVLTGPIVEVFEGQFHEAGAWQ